MKDIYHLEELEQLRVISDPLRLKVIWEIVDEAKTGKMIADLLEAPAPKIHYHLKELERVGLVTIERTEEKNGIVQKFYRPIARIFSTENILPHQKEEVKEELSDALKENILISMDKTKTILKKLDSHIFTELDQVKFGYNHVRLSKEQQEQLQNKAKELSDLIKSFKADHSPDGELHHLFMVAFPVKESVEGIE
ncbi:ArsR/SmtB family transcription factor [Fictibacillus iocasae]|uniref:ArsR/SmtB family transcription factor n=1 Tax=Fictibacillus iocasae TaxID=2715437 RepID=A0ABW2NKP4_9BACL